MFLTNSSCTFFADMVNKCCVPFCKSGYEGAKSRKKVHFFKFPSDETLRKAWLKRISREDFEPNMYSRVCSEHFKKEDRRSTSKDSRGRTIRLKKHYLADDAVPSVFDNYPSYKRVTETAPPRSEAPTSTARLARENEMIEQSIADFEHEDVVNDLCELKAKFLNDNERLGFTICDESAGDYLLFVKISLSDIPKIISSIKVFSDLSFVAYDETSVVKSSVYKDSMQFFKRIIRYSDFLNLLAALQGDTLKESPIDAAIRILIRYVDDDVNLIQENVKKISFLCEQLYLIDHSPGPKNSYSVSLLTTAILWKAYSTSCYKAILSDGLLTLPSLRTLRRVAQNVTCLQADTRAYLRHRASVLNEHEKVVTLVFDEVYVYQNIDYANGNFVGLAANEDVPATTVLCFLIKSLSSKYCDVVASIPIHKVNVDVLRKNCLKVLETVMECGFHVVSLIADNHSVNRSFFNSLSNNLHEPIVNPFDPSKKLYLLIDSVHTFKNVYNNFQKKDGFVFHDGSDFPVANFSDIKTMYNNESSSSLRLAHKLNERVFYPTNIQRTSAKLCMAVFDDSTVSAMK